MLRQWQGLPDLLAVAMVNGRGQLCGPVIKARNLSNGCWYGPSS